MKTDFNRALRLSWMVAILAIAISGAAIAQDVLGVEPVSQAGVFAIKAIAMAGIAFGFLRMMAGRHSIEGLVEMGIGGLGIAKSNAIAQFFGM